MAYEAARSAYGRARNGKGPAKALLEDKKLQKDLQDRRRRSAQTRATRCARARRSQRKRRPGPPAVHRIIGAGLALALSEDLRNKVLDALFGAEEEFDYTSTTAPPAPAPTAAASGASGASNN